MVAGHAGLPGKEAGEVRFGELAAIPETPSRPYRSSVNLRDRPSTWTNHFGVPAKTPDRRHHSSHPPYPTHHPSKSPTTPSTPPYLPDRRLGEINRCGGPR